MNTELGLIVAVSASVTAYFVRECFIIGKRPARKAELKCYIAELRSPRGCGYAEKRLYDCLHVMEHYGVSLSEVGFEGSLDNLCEEAYKSFLRYIENFREECSKGWSMYGDPDELGLVVPVAQGWDGYEPVQLYAQAKRRLKRLELRSRRFPRTARALLGRAFFLRGWRFSDKILRYG